MEMKIYKPKTLFSGYKIGLKNPDLYVGVPDKYFTGGEVGVEWNRETRYINVKDMVTTRTFDDKFQLGKTYTLYYFPWK